MSHLGIGQPKYTLVFEVFFFFVWLFVFCDYCDKMEYNQKFSNQMSPFFTWLYLTWITPARLCTTWTNHIGRIEFVWLNMTHISNSMIQIFKIIFTLHRVSGDSPPPSYIINYLVHHLLSYILLHILLF